VSRCHSTRREFSGPGAGTLICPLCGQGGTGLTRSPSIGVNRRHPSRWNKTNGFRGLPESGAPGHQGHRAVNSSPRWIRLLSPDYARSYELDGGPGIPGPALPRSPTEAYLRPYNRSQVHPAGYGRRFALLRLSLPDRHARSMYAPLGPRGAADRHDNVTSCTDPSHRHTMSDRSRQTCSCFSIAEQNNPPPQRQPAPAGPGSAGVVRCCLSAGRRGHARAASQTSLSPRIEVRPDAEPAGAAADRRAVLEDRTRLA